MEAPCPPVVSSAKGDKIDPVPAQMASYLACLCASARLALERTSLRGSCSPGPGWWLRPERLMNSWLVTPIGLVDVTSRCQLRAAGLSMVVMHISFLLVRIGYRATGVSQRYGTCTGSVEFRVHYKTIVQVFTYLNTCRTRRPETVNRRL